MKLYTCCPCADCGGFQAGLSFLHSWGIEPKIGHDEDGHYLEFTVPTSWPKDKVQRFCDELNPKVMEMREEKGAEEKTQGDPLSEAEIGFLAVDNDLPAEVVATPAAPAQFKTGRYTLRDLVPEEREPYRKHYGVFENGTAMVAWADNDKYATAIAAALNQIGGQDG
jgi:hypothetical protein